MCWGWRKWYKAHRAIWWTIKTSKNNIKVVTIYWKPYQKSKWSSNNKRNCCMEGTFCFLCKTINIFGCHAPLFKCRVGCFFSSWPKIVLLVYNLCKWWTTLFSTNNYFLISKISQILKATKSRKGLVHYNLSHGNTYIMKKKFVGQASKRLCQVQNLDWIYKGVWKEAKRNPKRSM